MLSEPILADSLYEQQLKIEKEMSARGIARYIKARLRAEEKGDAALLKPAERVLRHWFRPMRAMVEDRQALFKKQGGEYEGKGLFAAPIILQLPADLLATLTIRDVLGEMLNPRRPNLIPLVSITHTIGRSCMAEINMKILSRDEREVYERMNRRMRRLDPSKINFWSYRTLEKPSDYRKACIATGAMLLHMLIESASCGDYEDDVFEPAFRVEREGSRSPGRRSRRVLIMSSQIHRIIEDGHDMRKLCRPYYAPMVVPPTPWTRKLDGGYLRARFQLVSKVRGTQRVRIEQERRSGNMDRLLESVAYMDSTPWSINERVLRVQRAVWETGGDPALKVPERYDEPKPPMPVGFDGSLRGQAAWENVHPDEVKRWKRSAIRVHHENIQRASLRTQFLLGMDAADQFGKFDRLYLPHKLDFRGRMYPVPTALNHQDSDPTRALMQFADPVPGDNQRWLAIHAANCFGVDKVSFDDRVKWTASHASEILRCAVSPLEFDFWREADKPWQFLAACFALDDPKAGARLPVQMDGSCNGLQHLSAMTRDHKMAAPVNLVDGRGPGDVYMFVAGEAHKIASKIDPELCTWITRKVVKRPVMTSVYGLTPYSARNYVHDSLMEAGVERAQSWEMSKPLYDFIARGMKGACRGAEEAMAWLASVGSILARNGQLAEWTHPLGLPVVNPHINAKHSQVQTTLGNITVLDFDNEQHQKPKSNKQRNGMSPNFVHTLDAAHLQMTALAMKGDGMVLAAVHDSYWTHAAHVDTMQANIREQFVRLHSTPKLHEYDEQLRAKYPRMKIPSPPELGELDISAVRESTYFFH